MTLFDHKCKSRCVAWLSVPALLLAMSGAARAQELLTPEHAVETARFILNPAAVSATNPDGVISVSPTGDRYVFRVIHGDVASNGVWMEVYAGDLSSLEAAARPLRVARLFTTGLGSGGFEFLGPDLDTSELFNPIKWLDSRRIAFAWSDEKGVRQAVSLDLDEKQVRWLTQHQTPVGAFDVSKQGTVLFYADARSTAEDHRGADVSNGIVIPEDADAYAVFKGDLHSGGVLDVRMNTEWFISDVQAPDRTERLALAGRQVDLHNLHSIRFSPDGRSAVLNSAPTTLPDEWSEYTQRDMRIWIAECRKRPRGMMARGVQQLFILDVASRAARPLWNAPTVTVVTGTEWSPDGKSLLLAPTYLPVASSDGRGLNGGAVAVVDAATGRYSQLPIELAPMQTVAYLRWRDGNTLVVAEESRDGPLEHWFQRSDRLWKPIRAPASKRNRIRLEVRQSIETPPTIVAIDVASRAERIAFDPNPNLLKRFKFGRVDRVEGQLANGAEWDGLLFYPTDYVEGNKYPLVIQSVYENISPTFTLYGSTPLGPPEISAYPGRLLANRNVFVLHLNMRIGAKANTPAEAEARMAAFEQVPRQLAAKGLVDFERVGLIGFSRNAYYVEYTVTHSNTHFAAALSADGFDASYVPITMMGDMVNGAALIGQPPFGSGLEQWLERAPGFNVDRVNTPLRKIQQSFGTFGLLLNWEVFSRLRYLEKPVELYLVPDYERGAHNSQNPRQIIAVLQSTVDWFDFWLNGREDLSPEKSDQYKNWHRLRDLTSRASATPHQP